MRFHEDRSASPGVTATAPPAVSQCPFCRSPRVATTGKAESSSTYWRCEACGEIWNPTRQTAPRNHRGW